MQLYTSVELDQIQQDLPYLIETLDWVSNFLAKPHPNLGRSGLVCPFVPRSLQLNNIHFKVIRAKNLEQQQLEEIVSSYRDIFLELEPTEGEATLNKAILLIFPDVQEDDFKLIERVQQKLKPLFVDSGLMIGEFHKHNESPGLHNPNFRPLRSPIPMLAIRFMVEADLPFLQLMSDEPRLRIQYLEAYLQRMGKVFKDERKLQKAHEALAFARVQLEQETLASVRSNLSVIDSNAIDNTKVSTSVGTSVSAKRCPISRLGLMGVITTCYSLFDKARQYLSKTARAISF